MPPVTVKPKPSVAPGGLTRAADAITRDAIERLGDLLVGRNRGASASGKLLDGFELFAFDAAIFECPELRRQDPRRGFEQRRKVDVISTETHPMFAQRGARRLLETFDLVGDLLTIKHAERFRELERHAARYSCYVFGGSEPEQRLQESFDVRLEPHIEPRLHRITWRARETLIGDDAYARFERLLRGKELADRLPHPPHGAIGREHELSV